MGHDRNAPKRPINLSLNEDLVRQARAYTHNLSATLEILLQDFVATEEARRSAADQAVDRIIDGFDAFHRKYGLLSDEFSDF
jgi:antitoxin CcdA